MSKRNAADANHVNIDQKRIPSINVANDTVANELGCATWRVGHGRVAHCFAASFTQQRITTSQMNFKLELRPSISLNLSRHVRQSVETHIWNHVSTLISNDVWTRVSGNVHDLKADIRRQNAERQK